MIRTPAAANDPATRDGGDGDEAGDAGNAIRRFDRLRPRLHGIAYRMLASVAEAEDVVQDVWLRWHGANREEIDNAEAWLVSVTTRIAIDRLRAAKVQREHYSGFWLPEPALSEAPATPDQLAERADDLSVAFLMLLERLTPEARAAFLLREVFDAGYDEVASAIGKSEAACRQLVSRARTQLREARPRFAVSPARHRQLLAGFARALESGDFAALQALLAEDAVLIGDGGGRVPSFPWPMVGARRIAQLFYAGARRFPGAVRAELAVLNGQWALLRFIDGRIESAQTYETDGERIRRILVQRNPDKLARIAAARGEAGGGDGWAPAP
ncbi:RNA polymerase sigma-70 factor [Burkholderia gladioli]|uniref:RNA polymerase sigma-70 factor n=1 Tax=Burkholderia gladioli TaxID=28095 RepID=UPI001FC828DA|nr:RNA polymerase sigma-70 factor [Burkholderia gladioli]MDN7922988.1 RNA polymerase sigma-70 factor [Burkholderia gladioli]